MAKIICFALVVCLAAAVVGSEVSEFEDVDMGEDHGIEGGSDPEEEVSMAKHFSHDKESIKDFEKQIQGEVTQEENIASQVQSEEGQSTVDANAIAKDAAELAKGPGTEKHAEELMLGEANGEEAPDLDMQMAMKLERDVAMKLKDAKKESNLEEANASTMANSMQNTKEELLKFAPSSSAKSSETDKLAAFDKKVQSERKSILAQYAKDKKHSLGESNEDMPTSVVKKFAQQTASTIDGEEKQLRAALEDHSDTKQEMAIGEDLNSLEGMLKQEQEKASPSTENYKNPFENEEELGEPETNMMAPDFETPLSEQLEAHEEELGETNDPRESFKEFSGFRENPSMQAQPEESGVNGPRKSFAQSFAQDHKAQAKLAKLTQKMGDEASALSTIDANAKSFVKGIGEKLAPFAGKAEVGITAGKEVEEELGETETETNMMAPDFETPLSEQLEANEEQGEEEELGESNSGSAPDFETPLADQLQANEASEEDQDEELGESNTDDEEEEVESPEDAAMTKHMLDDYTPPMRPYAPYDGSKTEKADELAEALGESNKEAEEDKEADAKEARELAESDEEQEPQQYDENMYAASLEPGGQDARALERSVTKALKGH